MIYLNDDRDYSPIIEDWLREFMATMDDSDMRPGNDTGESPRGVKIIFDGYGEDDDGNPDITTESYAIFVHKDSLTEEFPEHESAWFWIVHRPKEEVCIYAWYDTNSDDVTVIPFEDNNSTELDPVFLTELIFKIAARDQ